TLQFPSNSTFPRATAAGSVIGLWGYAIKPPPPCAPRGACGFCAVAGTTRTKAAIIAASQPNRFMKQLLLRTVLISTATGLLWAVRCPGKDVFGRQDDVKHRRTL